MRYAFYCKGLDYDCCVMFQSGNGHWFYITNPSDNIMKGDIFAERYSENLRDLAFILPIIDKVNIQGPNARKYLREAIKYFAKDL